MLEYCKKSCSSKDTEICALPTRGERTRLRLAIIGAWVIDGFAASGGAHAGLSHPIERLNINMPVAKAESDAAYLPSQFCASNRISSTETSDES